MKDPYADYAAIDAVNWSTLSRMFRGYGDDGQPILSPLHYKHAVENPRPDTPAMRLGRLIHCAVLEPDELLARYLVWPERKAGKLYENTLEANPHHEIITKAEHETALAVRDAVRQHPIAGPLVSTGMSEVTVEWRDKATGIDCKARLDKLLPAGVVDLKTTRDISERRFGRTVAEYLYHGQAAFYCDGVATRLDMNGPHFSFVAVESSPPHDVAVWELDQDALWAGHDLVSVLLAELMVCRKTDLWPGAYPDRQILELPGWAYPEDEEEKRLMGLMKPAGGVR